MELAHKVSGGAVLLLAGLAAVMFLIEQVRRPATPTAPASVSAGAITVSPAPMAALFPALGADLIVPVAGVSARDLADSWGQARSQGRSHQGIDILAPRGATVRAVADGRIVKLFDSERGGITIYQFDRDERLVFYYAHLDSRAPGLAEGDQVVQGQSLGSVGMTGNAPVPHLHFEIQRLGAERRWWEAESINPYQYLREGQAPR